MKFKTSSQSHSFIEDVHRRVGARNKAVLGRAGLFLALNEGVPSDFKPADAQGVDLDDETIVGDELRDVVRAALNYRAKKPWTKPGTAKASVSTLNMVVLGFKRSGRSQRKTRQNSFLPW